ncbi:hypothetical protein C922_04583 [Plasmodium inui San Antonio 1]|uniref:Uncharacterized protein n=1 Tax=Plasmodium inui San Antonio 1 TaxID=1237626 RepID=W7A185_9APIC|nr:hypothetical protein C922_04583 [Plasmodium inui San Antonio 1]EUD65068.1 hypothetical protein C922_04583 [Plasmodium inui San Antonio 1]
MISHSKPREHGGTVTAMNHCKETSKTNRKGTGEEGVSMENIKTLYHIFSSADGNDVDGGDKKKCCNDMHDLKGAAQSEAAVMLPPRTHKNASPGKELNLTKRTNKEKEFLNHFSYLSDLGEYNCAHSADVQKRRNKTDHLSLQQNVEVTPDWEAFQRVDHVCDYSAKEGRAREGEIFDNSKRGMQRWGSHLKYHNSGERKKDTSSSPTRGEKSEQSQGRQPYTGGSVHLRREANPSKNSPIGETDKSAFVGPSDETSFYEAFTSVSEPMENKGTHFDNPFYRNSNVDELLDFPPQHSNHERGEAPLGRAKVTPLNWNRNYYTLTYLHSGNPKAEGETSKGEPSLNTVLHPKWDFLKCNEVNVQIERPQDEQTQDPFLNFIDQENSPDWVPFSEEHSYREDLTSAIFDSHAIANHGANKMDPPGGTIPRKQNLIGMDDFHTHEVSSLRNENLFGECSNSNRMKRGGEVANGKAVPFRKKLPIWESSLLEGDFHSSLFPMDGNNLADRQTKGGRLHIGGAETVCGHIADSDKDEEILIGDEKVIGKDKKVEKPPQWGKFHRVDFFQVVDRRIGGNSPPDSGIMKNASMERIKLHDQLINLSDGSTSEMGWTRKGTPPLGEPSVGLLSLEEECRIDGFNMMGEEKMKGGKSLLCGKHDFFDFEHDEEVDAPQRGSANWIGDIPKRMRSSEVGTTKEESHAGLLTATRHQESSKEKGEEEKEGEKEQNVLTYHDHYLTEQRLTEVAAPMDKEFNSFLDIIDEIVTISKDIIETNQNEDAAVEILQRSPDDRIESSQFGGHFPGELQMGLPLGVGVGAVVGPAEKFTHAGVYKDPLEDKLVDDVYVHFDTLNESCRKRQESCDEVVMEREREDSIHGAVHGAVRGEVRGEVHGEVRGAFRGAFHEAIHPATHQNADTRDVNTEQAAQTHWRNNSGETKDGTRRIEEEDPQESPSCCTTSEWADLPTMQLCEGLYRVLRCRDYLEALPVLAAHAGGKPPDERPISELSGMNELSSTTHCSARNYPSEEPLRGNVSLVTFHTYLRRAKKMNKRGFTEMYDYSDYVYTHIERIFQMDITRFFFTSNYLENINRYIIKKNRLINDLTNAQNFVNDFVQKREKVITQKRFCNDVTYPMYFLIFTNLLVTLWHTSLCHLDEANWSKLPRFLMRRLRTKTTIYVLRRSHSFLSRIYRHLTKHTLDEKKKKRLIRIVKRSRSFKIVQKNVHKINTFCFYVLILFLSLSVPPFGKQLQTRDYFLHCFLRNINKVVLRYAKEHTSDEMSDRFDNGVNVSSAGTDRGKEEYHHSEGNLHVTAPPSQSRRSENVRDVVRKAVSSSQKNIFRLKMHNLAQVFRCSFADSPREGTPVIGSTSSHPKGHANLQPNGLPNRQSNNLVEVVRDIQISTRIEQIEKGVTAYLRANAHFHDTFFNVIVPMMNGLTTLLDNLETIFALYVKHKVRKNRKLFFFRNPWLCSYDVFMSFSQSGGPAPNHAEESGMTRVTSGIGGSLTGSLTDHSTDSLPPDFAAYMAQLDVQFAQDDVGALYDVKRLKEMLLLGSRKKETSRRNTDEGHKRRPHKQNDFADRDRPKHTKLNAYYSYILKLCHDERYKEINTRALRCLFYSLYFS